jgi:alpha-tubulin suppressor-like RCC1 family protein
MLPLRVKTGLNSKSVVSCACSSMHTIVLTDDGSIYSFGNGLHGKLGKYSTLKSLT